MNLWKVSASGGWPIHLSESEEFQSLPAWSPDGKWIVFQQDFGGNDMSDLFVVPSDGGEVSNLTNTPDIDESYPQWSPDSKLLAMNFRPEDSRAIDVAVLDLKTRQVRNLTQDQTKDHLWFKTIWSADEKAIYSQRMNGELTDSDVYRISVETGELENLTPHQGHVMYAVWSVSPDGRTLLITSNERGGYQNVALLDIASKKRTWVTDLKWEARDAQFAPDGKSFTYVVNADGRWTIYRVDRRSGRTARLPLPEGMNVPNRTPTAFSPSGDRMLVSHQSSTEPNDLWVYDFVTHKARQLTFSALASLKSSRLPASQLVHYKTFDGKTISAFLWVPFNLKRDGSNPGVVLPHGGPTGQTFDSFDREAVALVSRGYVCIAPNVRGSSGYGEDFQKANYEDLGGGDLQDEVYAARFLAATGYVDAKRIGIAGASYGGYMALIAVGKTPDVWAAAVDIAGIANWLTEYAHEIPSGQEADRAILGDPVKDRQVYEDASPVKYFKNSKAPVLIIQGANDPSVPKDEAEQAETILRKEGKIVEAHYYADEGHGFFKRENQIDALERTVQWFDRYLKNKR